VLTVQRRLNAAGCGPVVESGRFGEPTTTAVKRFQMRFTDADGLPLKVDGIVGPITWAALFGTSQAIDETDEPLLKAALQHAADEIGVLEAPPGSNRGPRVDTYLRPVGLEPGAGSFAWCAAFVYFCFNEASQKSGAGIRLLERPACSSTGIALSSAARGASRGRMRWRALN
jgi:hypothetical protein